MEMHSQECWPPADNGACVAAMTLKSQKTRPKFFQDFQSSNQHGTVVKSPFFEKKCVLWARFPVRRVVYIYIYIYYILNLYIYYIIIYSYYYRIYIYIYTFFVLSYIYYYIMSYYILFILYYIILLILYFYYYMIYIYIYIYILYFYTYMYISNYIIHIILCILYCMYIFYIYSIIYFCIYIYMCVCMCYTSFLDSTYECQQPGTLVKMKTAGINIDALSQESGNIGLERFWYIHIHPHSPHRGTSSSPICFPCFPIIFLMFCQFSHVSQYFCQFVSQYFPKIADHGPSSVEVRRLATLCAPLQVRPTAAAQQCLVCGSAASSGAPRGTLKIYLEVHPRYCFCITKWNSPC